MRIKTPPENIIYQDADLQVILALDPISIAHVVIKPQDDYLDIDELPEPLLMKIMQMAQVYVRLLKKTYQPKGYSMMQNGGAFNDTGQFHLHVFPRFDKKEFSWTYSDEINEEALDYAGLQQQLKLVFEQLLDETSMFFINHK